MPKVPLTATKDFTYMTRRLTAGDAFEARNGLEARILTRVRKVAEAQTGKTRAEIASQTARDVISPPPSGGVAAAPTVERAAPKPAAKKAPAKRKAKAKK